jgi:hypothetical protein
MVSGGSPPKRQEQSMASIRKEILIDASPDDAWAALRDWGALHQRLVPGFVTDARLDGRDRIITFFQRRGRTRSARRSRRQCVATVYTVAGGAYAHFNASAQIFASGDGGTLFVWITDLLPDEAAERVSGLMEKGIGVIKQTLERG